MVFFQDEWRVQRHGQSHDVRTVRCGHLPDVVWIGEATAISPAVFVAIDFAQLGAVAPLFGRVHSNGCFGELLGFRQAAPAYDNAGVEDNTTHGGQLQRAKEERAIADVQWQPSGGRVCCGAALAGWPT